MDDRVKTIVVVPAKELGRAKERLAEILSPRERRALALSFIDGTLAALASLRARPTLLVVTDSEEIEARSLRAGAEVLFEREARGETAAVEAATCYSVEAGFARQLVVPADFASPDAADFERILSMELPPPSAVLSPATGDDGTNAILTSPPDALPYRFGARSFPDYLERARGLGLRYEIVRLPSLVLDVDTPEDLALFLSSGADSPARRLLAAWKVEERLAARTR